MPPTRCNSYFSRLVEHFTGFGPQPKSLHHRRSIEPFIAGFATGLAEKVHLQVCPGAMLAPQQIDHDWVFNICSDVAAQYKLHLRIWLHDGKGEIWLLNDSGLKIWTELQSHLSHSPENDQATNLLRAKICGIPTAIMDTAYPWRT